jgi:drug/metabolite transporter (DMT)-like permease
MSFGKMIEPLVAIVSAWFLFSEKPGEEILLSFVFTAVATLLILWPDQNDPRRV